MALRKRKLDQEQVQEQVREFTNDDIEMGDVTDVEIRSLLRVRKDEIYGVFDLNDRENYGENYGEMGLFADKLRIISNEMLQHLQNYQKSYEKGVVSDYSTKNHELSNLFQKDENALKRKSELKKRLYEEEINLECDFYFADLLVGNLNHLLQENQNIYLQDRLDERKYDHEELKRWIEAPNYNSEELMKKE